jgi:flagellar biogenesis protein FliO
MKVLMLGFVLATLVLIPAFGETVANNDQIAPAKRVSSTRSSADTSGETNGSKIQTTPAKSDSSTRSSADTPGGTNGSKIPTTPAKGDSSTLSPTTTLEGINAPPTQTLPANQSSVAPVAEPVAQIFQAEKSEESASSYSMLRAVGSLGLATFLMIVAYFAVKKFAPRYFAKGTSERNLKVLETLSMGDKRSISVIQMGKNRFLVGNTAHQISLLMALPDSVSLVSEPETPPENTKSPIKKDSAIPFKRLFEVEKKRPVRFAANPLPDDIRLKMRQLREALER